ncbi:hypothetical protein COB87_000655 [Candidatus Wolfebacteria bacterium]|nr:hypothetical protein [Candidatus Wolfebacteria bacterium]
MSLTTNKFAAGILSVGMFFALGAPVASAALTNAQIQSILSLLSSFGADASTISNVDASLRGVAPTAPVGGTPAFTWTRSLTVGDSGADVLALQKFLNSDAATSIAASGVGSAGSETDYFGGLTAAAVTKFQNKYASEVLTPVGLSAGTGFFGSSTRAKANSLSAASGTPSTPGNPTAPVTGAGLNVAIGVNSPVNIALVQGQGIGELAQFTFVNNNNAAMDVTNLTFNRIGVSTDSTLNNVYLYNGGARLTDAAGVSSSQFSFQNSAGIFSVAAGSSMTISVRADIATGTNGQQVGVELVSVGSTGALNSGVSFPIKGSTHTISSATLATLTFQTYSGPSGDSDFTPTDSVEVWENSVNIGTRAVNLQSLTLENRGSAAPSDIVNLQFFVDGVQYGATVASLDSNDRALFDLGSNPLRLETGTRTFRVLADVVGGSGETFDFEIRKSADVLAIDSELSQPVTPVLTATSGAINTIDSASLSIVRSNTSLSESVAVDATSVKWGTFEFRATGEDVKVEALTVDVTTSFLGGLDNGKVFLNGSQVGSTRDIAEAGTEFTFGSSMILKKGETAIVDIYADAKSTTGTAFSAGQTVLIDLDLTASNTEGVSSGDAITASINNTAAFTRTIASSTVTATKFSGYGNQTIIAGANSVRLGSFTLSGASTQDTNINTLTVTLSSAEAATITNLMLVDANDSNVTYGTTRVTPSTSNSFSVNFVLPESGTKTINIVGNVKSGSNNGSWIAVLSGTGSGAVTGTTATIASATLQTITIGSGTLTASVGAGDPNNDNVVAGQSSVHVGQFNFAAANSDYTVRELQIKIPNDSSTSITQVTLKYTNSAGIVVEADQALVTGAGDGTASFSNLDFVIPADEDRNIDVYVGVPTIASGAKAGAAISVDFDFNTGFKVVDQAGTTTTSVGAADISAAGLFYVRKSVPTFGSATKPTSVPSAGIALYEFTISADSAGAIEWKQLTIDVATNSVTLTDFYLREKGETTNINDTLVDANGSNDVVIIVGAAGLSDSDVEQIAAGSSRTYQLFATAVSGWGTSGDSININIVEDTSVVAVASSAGLLAGQNFVWSDRSATSHTTITSDWTNSFLVDDLSGGDAVSYSQS